MEQFLQNASKTEHLECSRDLLLFGIDDVVVVVGSRKRKKKTNKIQKQKTKTPETARHSNLKPFSSSASVHSENRDMTTINFTI